MTSSGCSSSSAFSSSKRRVVLGVGDLRVVEDVVAVVVVVEQLAAAPPPRAASEDGKELLRRVDERVRADRLRAARAGGSRPSVTATAKTPRRLRRAACRTASRRRTRRRPAVSPKRPSAKSSGSGWGLCRSVSSAPTTTSRCDSSSGIAANASWTVALRFAVTTPSLAPLALEDRKHVEHPRALGQLGVERLVVLAVVADELLDPALRRSAASARAARSRRPPPSGPRRGSRGRAPCAWRAASRRG